MKTEIKDIQIGQGLGLVKFGMSREQVVSILGEPTDKETIDEANLQSEIWHYDVLNLSLGYDKDENWRLVSLAVSSDFYTFDSAALVGKTLEEVEDKLETSELHDIDLQEMDDEDGVSQCLLESVESEINFWFENNTLSEIQWGPLFKDDETIIWPS